MIQNKTTPDGLCPICSKTPMNGYVRRLPPAVSEAVGGPIIEQCIAACHDAFRRGDEQVFLVQALRKFVDRQTKAPNT